MWKNISNASLLIVFLILDGLPPDTHTPTHWSQWQRQKPGQEPRPSTLTTGMCSVSSLSFVSEQSKSFVATGLTRCHSTQLALKLKFLQFVVITICTWWSCEAETAVVQYNHLIIQQTLEVDNVERFMNTASPLHSRGGDEQATSFTTGRDTQ